MIPIFDIKRQNKLIRKDIDQAIRSVIDKGVYILGPSVSRFEEEFGTFIGVRYAVGVASGTDALSLSLLALGVGEGDEVLLPANAYPCAFALTAIGAVPKLVDIDPETYTIDPEKIPHAIAKKTKAIIPVHLYGQAAAMGKIMEIGRKYNIPIIEDCAQAHGASILSGSDETFFGAVRTAHSTFRTLSPSSLSETLPPKTRGDFKVRKRQGFKAPQKAHSSPDTLFWRKAGSIGDIGCFSFYPTKNLGCFGDGGMVVTNNKEIYEKVKLLRMYGEKKRYESVILGRNSRLDELQAAILLVKLKYLDRWNDRRREIANLYISFLAGPVTRVSQDSVQVPAFVPLSGTSAGKLRDTYIINPSSRSRLDGVPRLGKPSLVPPANNERNGKSVYHLFVIRTNKRDRLKEYLEKKGIGTGIHYPKPIHLEPSFRYLGYKRGDFPESEKASKEVLSLPMYPELTNEEVKQVSTVIRSFFV